MWVRVLKHAVMTAIAFALALVSPMPSAQQSPAPAKSPATKAPDAKAPTSTAIQKMRKKEDKIQGITWFMDKSTPDTNNRNNVHLYIGQKGTQVWLRWKLQYASDSWLFVKGYIVAADDKRFERRARFERDHYTTIWEWHDTTAGPSDLEIVQAIIAAKEVTIRYVGDKYYGDRKVSPQEKQALKNVLEAYIALGGKL
jgi:hypothetical protein